MDSITLNEKIADASKTIFNYCMAKTSTREDAEDLSQEILLELVRSVGNIRDERAFYGFMWAVAGNVYKQWYRKKLRKIECELTDDVAAAEEDRYFAENEYDDIYLLRRELSLLAQKYRRATILYYIERKSCPEIAEILSVSESMVKYLLFKSRKILKEGMNMERKLGELSYNPKTFTPLYMGSGPNCFWDFMQSKIRQNIVAACYNDSLTPEQISLETGIPLPYLEYDIAQLEEKQIIVKEGAHYKANVIVITAECAAEMHRSAAKYHGEIADKIGRFLDENVGKLREQLTGGADFSENTLRWQLAMFVFGQILNCDVGNKAQEKPQTAWGDYAYTWLAEQYNSGCRVGFSVCDIFSKRGDRLHFLDYLPEPKSDHHYFWGREHYTEILCDIVHGKTDDFSEYDFEVAADLIKSGYVVKSDDGMRAAMPVYTEEQIVEIDGIVSEFVNDELAECIKAINESAVKILSDHTPKYLQSQVAGIAGMDRFGNAVTMPAQIMLERGYLHTSWKADEMPTMCICMSEE